MFRGRYIHTIDGKGRLSIPVPFREILSARYEETLVITNFDRCLVGFPPQEWEAVEAKVRGLPMLQKDARAFIRFFYSGAIDCRLDRQGRVLIPPSLREFAELERDVVVLGSTNRIEIWAKARWEEFIKNSQENFEEISSKLEGII